MWSNSRVAVRLRRQSLPLRRQSLRFSASIIGADPGSRRASGKRRGDRLERSQATVASHGRFGRWSRSSADDPAAPAKCRAGDFRADGMSPVQRRERDDYPSRSAVRHRSPAIAACRGEWRRRRDLPSAQINRFVGQLRRRHPLARPARSGRRRFAMLDRRVVARSWRTIGIKRSPGGGS